MTADQLKTLTTDALDRLTTLLDEGHSERLTALLKTMGRFHRYSFHNLCLIAIETADDLGGALGTSTRERIQILERSCARGDLPRSRPRVRSLPATSCRRPASLT